jgi:hypothetical protein
MFDTESMQCLDNFFSQYVIFSHTISGLEESLKLLLTMHPFTYSLWVKLGYCYQIQMKNSKNNIKILLLVVMEAW